MRCTPRRTRQTAPIRMTAGDNIASELMVSDHLCSRVRQESSDSYRHQDLCLEITCEKWGNLQPLVWAPEGEFGGRGGVKRGVIEASRDLIGARVGVNWRCVKAWKTTENPIRKQSRIGLALLPQST
jgi:hypothetical protein